MSLVNALSLFATITLLLPLRDAYLDAEEAVPTADQLEFFEKQVRPILVKHCYSCHSVKAKKLQAGLLVDSRAALIKGGDSGEAIVPGDAPSSLLIEAVNYESYEMPPKGKLPQKDIQILERWVEIGAPWPNEEAPEASAARPEFDLQRRRNDHWAWQPIQAPKLPDVANVEWTRVELDHFVLARLEEENLHPATDAERTALLRRLFFDLIGLPPTPEQTAQFLNDTSPQATERLVDELLNSPHFGERWGRHWLDLVRYAESRGHEFDNDSPNAFQYRDYIIRALNLDVPYDQLVREHIAGDLLVEPRLNLERSFNESVLGTGFWFLGEWVHSPVDIRKDEADRFDNMIDVMSKAFLGVTVACARCHDHKFDAISTADYYALSGFLQSSNYRQVRFESIESNRRVAKELATVDEKFQQMIADELSKAGASPLTSIKPVAEKAADFVIVDYRLLPTEQYLQDGFIFGKQPRRTGQAYLENVAGKPVIRFSTGGAVNDPIWNGLESVYESGVQNRSQLAKLPRSGRTLRTPTFTLNHGNVICRVRGAGHVVACVDSHRLIAGPLHGNTIVKIPAGKEWIQLNLNRYVGHRLHLEFTPAKNAQLEVLLVTDGASKAIQNRLLERESEIGKAVEAFAESADRLAGDRLKQLAISWADEREKLQSRIVKRSRTAMAMMDGSGENDHILIRGNSSKPGDITPRRFLSAVSGDQPIQVESGSGRLELARQINDPANPLTSRVIVNRIWHHLLGRGIVPTTDDFGVLGQRPTHPKLLDHLATRFVEDGRSIKQMIRYIVLSRTYQLSSHSHPPAVNADPKNRLWHHRPPKRLEGEVIRDALLALGGRLETTPFGEPVPIHLTPFMDGRGRPKSSGPLDGHGRRSIYIAVRRNFLSPFMLTFDTPVPFSTMGRRNVSNVPAQALILMNDPLVVEQSRKWAERALQATDSNAADTIESRIAWMYVSGFARHPSKQETQTALRFLNAQATTRAVELNDPALWADLAHALVNTKEFIFLR